MSHVFVRSLFFLLSFIGCAFSQENGYDFDRKDSCYEAIQISLALSGRPLSSEIISGGYKIIPGNCHFRDIADIFKASSIRFENLSKCPPEGVLSRLNDGYAGVIIESSSSGDSTFYVINLASGVPYIHKYPALNQKISKIKLIELVSHESVKSFTFFSPEEVTHQNFVATSNTRYVPEVVSSVENKDLTERNTGTAISFPKIIHVGKLARSAKMLVASFELENSGGDPIEISKLQGTCTCFLRAEYPRTIAPMTRSTVILYFNPERFRFSEKFKTSVAFELNDKTLKQVGVTVIGEYSDENYCFLSFDALDLGALTRAQLSQKLLSCSLYALDRPNVGFKVLRSFTQPDSVDLVESNNEGATLSKSSLFLIQSYKFKIQPEKFTRGGNQLDMTVETNDKVYKQISASVKFTLID